MKSSAKPLGLSTANLKRVPHGPFPLQTYIGVKESIDVRFAEAQGNQSATQRKLNNNATVEARHEKLHAVMRMAEEQFRR